MGQRRGDARRAARRVFAGDPAEAARQAELAARVTHTHPEAVAGAVAVAVAAALAANVAEPPAPDDFVDIVMRATPEGRVRDGLRAARGLARVDSAEIAAHELGNGSRVSAWDTVPFTVWSAARALDDYEHAFWTTARAGGDVDTTCAIVGGIVAARVGMAGLPPRWIAASEALPGWVDGIAEPT